MIIMMMGLNGNYFKEAPILQVQLGRLKPHFLLRFYVLIIPGQAMFNLNDYTLGHGPPSLAS